MNSIKVVLIESEFNNSLLAEGLNYADFKYLQIQYTPLLIEKLKEIQVDIAIFNIKDISENLLITLQHINQQLSLPVIIFSEVSDWDTINKAIKAGVISFIVDDLAHNRLTSIIRVAIARFKQQEILKNALEDARIQLEDRKQIDRAKAILIKTRGFTEDVAYHTLRKLAMDRNITLGEMARNVIAMAELLK